MDRKTYKLSNIVHVLSHKNEKIRERKHMRLIQIMKNYLHMCKLPIWQAYIHFNDQKYKISSQKFLPYILYRRKVVQIFLDVQTDISNYRVTTINPLFFILFFLN